MSYDQFFQSLPGRDALIIGLSDPLQDFYASMRVLKVVEYDVAVILDVALRELSEHPAPLDYLGVLPLKLAKIFEDELPHDVFGRTYLAQAMVAIGRLVQMLYIQVSIASENTSGSINHRLSRWMGPFSILLEKHLDVDDGETQPSWRDAISIKAITVEAEVKEDGE